MNIATKFELDMSCSEVIEGNNTNICQKYNK